MPGLLRGKPKHLPMVSDLRPPTLWLVHGAHALLSTPSNHNRWPYSNIALRKPKTMHQIGLTSPNCMWMRIECEMPMPPPCVRRFKFPPALGEWEARCAASIPCPHPAPNVLLSLCKGSVTWCHGVGRGPWRLYKSKAKPAEESVEGAVLSCMTGNFDLSKWGASGSWGILNFCGHASSDKVARQGCSPLAISEAQGCTGTSPPSHLGRAQLSCCRHCWVCCCYCSKMLPAPRIQAWEVESDQRKTQSERERWRGAATFGRVTSGSA